MSNESEFADYLRALQQFTIREKTEHTDRSAIEHLLNAFAERAEGRPTVQHEPKRAADKGAPDFKIVKSGMILGYVETKKIGENLAKVIKSDQLKRYRELSPNILLTDYLEWIWIRNGTIRTEALCHETDLENRRFRLREERIAAVGELIEGFFSTAPLGIGRSQQLALALATRSKYLRDFLTEELVRQEREHREGRLFGLYEIFRDQVFHDLKLSEFADAFAQMLAYGLFLARLNAKPGDGITLRNARYHIPRAFRLIAELVDFLGELDKEEYRDVRWVIEEILSIVNGLDLRAIHEDLSFRQRKAISRKVRAADEEEHRLFERDPFIYFYEDFLKAYDPAMRKGRGVYYTPPPVVNFIVRAVDDILKDSFGMRDGLADNKRVTVLDFACGTGTFLLEIFQQIFENIGGADSARAALVVRDHVLKNIYGFEYLIAPYTIAHLKLSKYLSDRGHALKGNDRLQVFLTNTVEPIEPQKALLLPAVSEEVRAAQNVKEMPILVITGNPPYAGHSKNKGQWITASIDEYKSVWRKGTNGLEERAPLGEKNSKWLQDDYVKFIRFGQMKMDGFTFSTVAPDGKLIEHSVPGVERGVVAIITNHSYLDNPTFRGMRQSLLRTFDQIYILDLHGSTKPKEGVPADTENDNVFDIQKGVAIAVFVKNLSVEKGVWFSEIWGNRLEKYSYAADTKIRRVPWKPVEAVAPYFLFRPSARKGWDEYIKGWPIADSLNARGSKLQIFDVNVLGFQTHRDHFAIGFAADEIRRRVLDLRNPALSDQTIREQYRLTDNRDWNLGDARKHLNERSDWERPIIPCAYRPFDQRACYFGYEIMDYPRRELLESVAWRENVGLLVSRQIGTEEWRHVFVADCPANDCAVSDKSREANYIFPLWLYPASGERAENISIAFREFVDARFGYHYTCDEIFRYIYAILYAPGYRARYAEFLRSDFPRIPFPERRAEFEKLSELGRALVNAHLLRELPLMHLAQYLGKGDHSVEAVRYSEAEQAICINSSQRFAPVPPDIWSFRIGGYSVIEKFLKSRKGQKLSLDEIDHVSAVAAALAFTIGQMKKIDAAYRAAFPDGG